MEERLSATTRPVTDEGRVFVSAGDAIHALSDANGTEAVALGRWKDSDVTDGPIGLADRAR